MTPELPSVRGLHALAVARAKSMEPQVLAFGAVPPDETSRGAAYVIIDPDPGFDEIARADGRTTSRRGRFMIRACGSSVEQALYALDRARVTFADWRPYESLRFGAARETEADPLTRDRSVPTDTRYVLGLTYEIDD